MDLFLANEIRNSLIIKHQTVRQMRNEIPNTARLHKSFKNIVYYHAQSVKVAELIIDLLTTDVQQIKQPSQQNSQSVNKATAVEPLDQLRNLKNSTQHILNNVAHLRRCCKVPAVMKFLTTIFKQQKRSDKLVDYSIAELSQQRTTEHNKKFNNAVNDKIQLAVDEAVNCKICFTTAINAVIQPCGHSCCMRCGIQLMSRNLKCAFCRQDVTDIMSVYL